MLLLCIGVCGIFYIQSCIIKYLFKKNDCIMTDARPTLSTHNFFKSLTDGDVTAARAHIKGPDVDLDGVRSLCGGVNVFELFASKSLNHLTPWLASNTPEELYSPVYRLEVLEFILEHKLAVVSPDVFLQHVLRGIDTDVDKVSSKEDHTVARMLDCAFNQNRYGIGVPTEQQWTEAYALMTWGYPDTTLTQALQSGWFDFMFKDIVADDLYNTFIQHNWQLERFLPKEVVKSMPWSGSSSIPGVFNTYERVMDVRPELFDWSDGQRRHIFGGVCKLIFNQWSTHVADKLLALAHENTDDTRVFIERINTMCSRHEKPSDQQVGVLLAILNHRPELLAEHIALTSEGRQWTVYDLFTQKQIFSPSWNSDSNSVQDFINAIEQLESARQQRMLSQHLSNAGVRSKTARI